MTVTVPPEGSRSRHMFINEHGIWVAYCYRDGKQWRRSTGERDFVMARSWRDRWFAELRKHHGASDIQRKVSKDAYIYQRDPFVVRVMGRYVGSAPTKREARTMRDNYLKGGAK